MANSNSKKNKFTLQTTKDLQPYIGSCEEGTKFNGSENFH